MSYRKLAFSAAMAAVAAMTMVTIEGQAPARPAAPATTAASRPYTPPRTSWGDPDFQGIWRALDLSTPFERPLRYGSRANYTEVEIAARLKAMRAAMEARCKGQMVSRGFRAQPNYNSVHGCSDDDMAKLVPHRTSQIIDPPNGRMPVWTMEQVKLWEERERLTAGRGETDDTEDMDITGRCLRVVGQWGLGRSNIPLDPAEVARRKAIADSGKVIDVGEGFSEEGGTGGPGNTETFARRVLQAPGWVAMVRDEGGEYHMYPTDGRPPLGPKIRQYRGEPRAKWEGNTLVVDITGVRPVSMIIPNFQVGYIGTGETLRVVERWTRLSADTLEQKVTVIDPAVWVQPFTFVREYTREDDFKFTQVVCQENTKDLGGSLAHARADEALADEYGESSREERKAIVAERIAEAKAYAAQQR